jgi:hypothetical protein
MISVNYLAHNRPKEFWEITKYFLNKIKSENKFKIRVNILATETPEWESLDGIETNLISFSHGGMNYMEKINYALSEDSEYSVKLDEDCFINNHVWDYMIENVNILDSEDNFAFAPLLSNNIPLVDQFIETFVVDEDVKNKIFKDFLKRNMPNGLWGADYSSLNEHTINAYSWNPSAFYDGVRKINHHYKGIHPIRICAEAQVILNDYIMNNFDRILDKQEYSIQEFACPYYTNSVFFIKTEDWRKVISLTAYDAFDEVQFNIFKEQFNKKTFYVGNGFSFHLTYNTIHNANHNAWGIGMQDGKDYEVKLVDQICKILDL